MNFNIHNQNFLQGVLLLVAGSLLLLYMLGLITTGVNLVLIAIAIGLIMYGAVVSGLDQIVKKLVNTITGKK